MKTAGREASQVQILASALPKMQQQAFDGKARWTFVPATATFGDREPDEKEAVWRSLEFLWSLPETDNVEDLQQIRAFQSQGVDLAWYKRDGSLAYLDVKGDSQAHLWGNYIVELLSVQELRIPGNFITSKSNLWHYHILEPRQLHVWDLNAFREWFYAENRTLKTFRTRTKKAGGNYHTWGLRLPIEDVLQARSRFVEVIQLPF